MVIGVLMGVTDDRTKEQGLVPLGMIDQPKSLFIIVFCKFNKTEKNYLRIQFVFQYVVHFLTASGKSFRSRCLNDQS